MAAENQPEVTYEDLERDLPDFQSRMTQSVESHKTGTGKPLSIEMPLFDGNVTEQSAGEQDADLTKRAVYISEDSEFQ